MEVSPGTPASADDNSCRTGTNVGGIKRCPHRTKHKGPKNPSQTSPAEEIHTSIHCSKQIDILLQLLPSKMELKGHFNRLL